MRKKMLPLLLLGQLYYSQNSGFQAPMSPEAYQFKKRMANNVSLYTGHNSVEIPIYEINLDGMKIPISISYNTGGIKTDEESSIIGLGWMLNIGGEISRTNNGALDERFFMKQLYNTQDLGIGSLKEPIITGMPSISGYPDPATDPGMANAMGGINRISFYINAEQSNDPTGNPALTRDTRPDSFYYRLPDGKNGKFMFSQKLSKFVTFPLDDIQIGYTVTNPVAPNQKERLDFNIKLSNGFNAEYNHNQGVRSMKSNVNFFPYDQSWQLSSLTSPSGKVVQYLYNPVSYNLCTNYGGYNSNDVTHNDHYISESMDCSTITNVDSLPYQIFFPDGKIIFNYTTRLDLPTGSKRLSDIKVYDNAGTLIKTIILNQSYLVANTDVNSIANISQYANNRLKLNSVDVKNGNDSSMGAIERYYFDYYINNNLIPSKDTSHRDHWNYYNGGGTINIGSNLTPLHKGRYIDKNYSNTFSLKSITFPEGGKKEFVYENNSAIVQDPKIQEYYDDLTVENINYTSSAFNITGYDLNSFYPTASGSTNNYPSGNKLFYGNSFVIKQEDLNLNGGTINITATLSSNLPIKAPNYQQIDEVYNNVAFEFENVNTGAITYLGKISKNTQSSFGTTASVNTTGTYRFRVIVNKTYYVNSGDNINVPHSTGITYSYKVRKDDPTISIGGLRIARINTYTKGSDSTPSYATSYSYLDDNGKTSGKVVNVPSYYRIMMNVRQGAYENGDTNAFVYVTSNYASNPINNMYQTEGSNVGYTKITETDINLLTNEQRKQSSYFNFTSPLFSFLDAFSDYTYIQGEPNTWMSGKLINKIYYLNNAKQKEEIYEYYGQQRELQHDEVDEINSDLLDMPYIKAIFDGSTAYYGRHINSFSLGNPSKYNMFTAFPSSNPSLHGVLGRYFPNNIQYSSGQIVIPYFKIYTGFDKIKSKSTIDYVGNSALTTITQYTYDTANYFQLQSETTIQHDGTISKTEYKYAQDKSNQLMISKNMIGIPLETTTTQTIGGTTKTLSKTETIYPTSQSDANTKTSGLVLPTSFLSYDLQNVTSSTTEVTYDKYDSKGNIQQYTTKDGIPTAIIWGYNNTQPIAKIVGATYAQVSSLATAIISASDTDASAAPGNDETAILTALDTFRKDSSMAGYQITTYTYDPLIGVRSITPPSGIREVYLYDTANRLMEIREGSQTGKLLKEFKYNYKN